MRKTSVYILFFIFFSVLTFFSSCKVVKHSDIQKKNSNDEVTFYFENENFDAVKYVLVNWESRVLPEINETAIELSTILEGIQNNFDSTAKKYGVRKDESSPYSFAVKGISKIKEINRESAAGILYLDESDLTQEGSCRIQIGPVIKKSAVRDYLSFIQFGDFENQIEYANVSRELNFYIRDNVVNDLDSEYTVGSGIEFTGVFTYDKSGEVLITPVSLRSAGGTE